MNISPLCFNPFDKHVSTTHFFFLESRVKNRAREYKGIRDSLIYLFVAKRKTNQQSRANSVSGLYLPPKSRPGTRNTHQHNPIPWVSG